MCLGKRKFQGSCVVSLGKFSRFETSSRTETASRLKTWQGTSGKLVAWEILELKTNFWKQAWEYFWRLIATPPRSFLLLGFFRRLELFASFHRISVFIESDGTLEHTSRISSDYGFCLTLYLHLFLSITVNPSISILGYMLQLHIVISCIDRVVIHSGTIHRVNQYVVTNCKKSAE